MWIFIYSFSGTYYVWVACGCIWVATPVDWVFLYWCACGTDGRSVARALNGHVISKFSRMGRFTQVWGSTCARFARALSSAIICGKFCFLPLFPRVKVQNWPSWRAFCLYFLDAPLTTFSSFTLITFISTESAISATGYPLILLRQNVQ